MKLFVQIPCFNEAQTLPAVMRAIPLEIRGIDSICTLIIDDGSTDGTAEVALSNGADHVIRHPQNLGLAAAFFSGLAYCLENGADVIVNTDGDGQYPSKCIADLLSPVVSGRADIAIGTRLMPESYYSRSEKRFHTLGSALLNFSFDTSVADPPSGFRAYNRRIALELYKDANFSYTLPTIIQSRRLGADVVNVPFESQVAARNSRLAPTSGYYMRHAALDVVRSALRRK